MKKILITLLIMVVNAQSGCTMENPYDHPQIEIIRSLSDIDIETQEKNGYDLFRITRIGMVELIDIHNKLMCIKELSLFNKQIQTLDKLLEGTKKLSEEELNKPYACYIGK